MTRWMCSARVLHVHPLAGDGWLNDVRLDDKQVVLRRWPGSGRTGKRGCSLHRLFIGEALCPLRIFVMVLLTNIILNLDQVGVGRLD